MVSRDHKLSMRKQCELLQLSRSRLYYQPVGESAENLRFMESSTSSSWKRLGMDRAKWPGT